MEDQVIGLLKDNIKACFLGSNQNKSAEVLSDLRRGVYNLLYVTPEYVSCNFRLLEELNSRVGITLFAIDEAHCVSQWGHDFRADYRKLGRLKETFPNVPILAMTATATLDIRKDMSKSLLLKDPEHTCTGFDRPNLFLKVKQKCGKFKEYADMKGLMKNCNGKYRFEGSTIIYVQTRDKTEVLNRVLKNLGVKSAMYHAGMDLVDRKNTHHMFIKDEVQVVVATIAFGMGINKPDVRQVIHYGVSNNMESYYQEIGRAGRDRKPAFCTVVYLQEDFDICYYFLKDVDKKFKEHRREMIEKMEQYLTHRGCRRRKLMEHFSSTPDTGLVGTKQCCDNCYSQAVREESRRKPDIPSKKSSNQSSKPTPCPKQTNPTHKSTSHILSDIQNLVAKQNQPNLKEPKVTKSTKPPAPVKEAKAPPPKPTKHAAPKVPTPKVTKQSKRQSQKQIKPENVDNTSARPYTRAAKKLAESGVAKKKTPALNTSLRDESTTPTATQTTSAARLATTKDELQITPADNPVTTSGQSQRNTSVPHPSINDELQTTAASKQPTTSGQWTSTPQLRKNFSAEITNVGRLSPITFDFGDDDDSFLIHSDEVTQATVSRQTTSVHYPSPSDEPTTSAARLATTKDELQTTPDNPVTTSGQPQRKTSVPHPSTNNEIKTTTDSKQSTISGHCTSTPQKRKNSSGEITNSPSKVPRLSPVTFDFGDDDDSFLVQSDEVTFDDDYDLSSIIY